MTSEETIMVSIICNTYNHEKYIRDALNGFVKQETDYLFEILVHDDASTDGTAKIIKEFEMRYPNLIKPYYQSENQYSKHNGVISRIQYGRAQGKYVAICEGDDYWVDPHKLQRQIEYMEAHPDCTFCFTNAIVQYGETFKGKVIPWGRSSVIKAGQVDFDAGELELLGYIPTASFVFPRSLDLLKVEEGSFKGDSFRKWSMTAQGYAHFIDEPMCVYRRSVNESATTEWSKNNDAYLRACDAFEKLYRSLMQATNHRFDSVLQMRVCEWKIQRAFISGNNNELIEIRKSGELKYLKTGNFYSRLSCLSKCICPEIVRAIRDVRNKIIGNK